tara:strand:- start:2075 stop:2368 length:294 start_codon:yes stop_codon:yes gene_type:complete
MSKQDGRNSPVSKLPGVMGDAAKGVLKSVGDTVTSVFKRDKGKGPTKKKGQAPTFGAKPPKKGGRKRKKSRRKRRKSRRKRRKSRRKRRKSRRKRRR